MSSSDIRYLALIMRKGDDFKGQKKKAAGTVNMIKEMMRKKNMTSFDNGPVVVKRKVSKSVPCNQKNIKMVFGEQGWEKYKKQCTQPSERFTFKLRKSKHNL